MTATSAMSMLQARHARMLVLSAMLPTHTCFVARERLQANSFTPDRYRERGVKTTSAFAGQLEQVALAMPQMCCSMYIQASSHLRQVPRQSRLACVIGASVLDSNVLQLFKGHYAWL